MKTGVKDQSKQRILRVLFLFMVCATLLIIAILVFSRRDKKLYYPYKIKPIKQIIADNKKHLWFTPELYTCDKSRNNNSEIYQERIIHLDLKGAPPKISYFETLFPLLKQMGATGLLIEYEDMFPYSGNLKEIPRSNAYNVTEINKILKLANESGLKTIIPLIQTFGHLSYLLKHERFKHLREKSSRTNALAPGHPETLPILKDMLSQVARYHSTSKYFHIGSDEVYGLGEGQSRDFMQRMKFTKEKLLLWHVKRVVGYIKSLGFIPIMWDDMFRATSVEDLQSSGLGTEVEIMIWKYSPIPQNELPRKLFHKYAQVFKKAWIASAFKGAENQDEYIVNTPNRIKNHINWLSMLHNYRQAFQNKLVFTGSVLTGWQRFDHYRPLCELLPVGIPSLGFCLQILKYGCFSEELHRYVSVDLLNCDNPLILNYRESVEQLTTCDFPGFDIFDEVNRLGLHKRGINSNFSKLKLKSFLRHVYYENTVTEWFKKFV